MQSQVFKRGLPRPRRFVMPEARSEPEQMILDDMKRLIEWENHRYPYKGVVKVANVEQPENASPSEIEMARKVIALDMAEEAQIDFDSSVTQRDLTGMIQREEKKLLKLNGSKEAMI